MKIQLSVVGFAAAVSIAAPAAALEPIPGSITYGGQPATRLVKAPIGSPVAHEFFSEGTRYSETYIIQADRTLKLVDRVRQPGH